jgi:NitT/TauT family transport system ATP-binding protein
MNNILELNNISKKYHSLKGEINAIDNISINIKEGEIIAIVGPSGCGKSTLLSIIANLDNNYNGIIKKSDNLKIAYMLQNDALLSFLTIYENATLGLKIQNEINDYNLKYVDYLFKLYNLNEFKNNYPYNLSGGMRQRVALIRTLALKPDLLLLDEPFSALDEQSRLLISDDVYKIIKKEKKTVILITHSIEEAIMFADRIIVLSKRPAKIKKIYNIEINSNSIYERRKDLKFNNYFESIWKDLDKLE